MVALKVPPWKVLRLSLVGMALGGFLGLASSPSPAVADGGCECTMPELGSYKCPSPDADHCIAGGWKCKVECQG